MNDKQLDQFIEDGIKQINHELKTDEDIRDQAEYLARMLAINPVVKAEVDGKVFVLTMKMVKLNNGKQIISLAAEDEMKKVIYGNKYVPALFTVEFNDYFTLEENCQTLLSAFIGKVTGNFKIEELEDDGIYKVAREKDFK